MIKGTIASRGNWLFRWRSYILLGFAPFFMLAMMRPEPIEASFGGFWDSAYETFCLFLAFLGLGIRAFAAGFAPAGASGRNMRGQATEGLSTTGIYWLTRNPLYLGNSLIYVAVALFTQNLYVVLAMVLFLAAYLERTTATEKRLLGPKPADAADGSVALGLFPRLRGWKEPALSFSFRNMLRREYSGLLAIVAIFLVMDQGREYVTANAPLDADWLMFLLVGAALFFVLRALEKHAGHFMTEGSISTGIAAEHPAIALGQAATSLSKSAGHYLPYFVLALLFAATIAFRPLMPVDETRYLSVSWEMLLTKHFLVPTMNFAPYFQKPPLLFWLVDIVWSIFGVSRVAALLVPFGAAALTIYLSVRLARALFPADEAVAQRVSWLLLGNVAFAVYSSLIFFDMLLTVFMLAAALAFLAFARGHGLRFALLAGLFIGLGGMTKGPVILIQIGWMVLLYPFWRDPRSGLPARKFFVGIALALLIAVGVGLLWLLPVAINTGGDFIYNLVWKQAEGRLAGNFRGSHPQPAYYYLLVLPVAALPWYLSPHFWRARPWTGWTDMPVADKRAVGLLTLWSLGVLTTFSLIAGKQPHYILPVVPVAIIALAYFMRTVPLGVIRNGALVTLTIFCLAEAVASFTLFRDFDLAPLGNYVAERRDAPWAFNGDYEAQLNFLARLEKPIEIVDDKSREHWLASHPDGYLIKRYKVLPPHGVVFSIPVEKGYLAVTGGKHVPAPGQGRATAS